MSIKDFLMRKMLGNQLKKSGLPQDQQDKLMNAMIKNPQLFERQVDITPESLVRLTNQKYQLKQFEDVSGADALYLKAVHFATKNS